jgi:hypothetical protein
MTLVVLASLCVLAILAMLLRAIQHTVTINWSSGTNNLLATVVATGQEEINISLSIAATTTNQALPAGFAFTLAKLQSIYILASGALTLKTNSSGSPQDTITLAADEPIVWLAGSGMPALFAGNITSGFVTNAGGSAVQLDIRCCVVSP